MVRARSLAFGLVIALSARASAQTPVASSGRRLPIDASRLTPGQFVYQAALEHDSTATPLGTRTVSATQTTYNGANAWLLVETKSDESIPSLDTLFAERGSLRPLHWSSTIGSARLGLEFRNDSAFGGTTAPAGRRSVFSAVPSGTLVNAAMLEMALRTLPLGPSWEDSTTTISVSLTGVSTLPTRVTVIGEDSVRVPAGQFDCWVVSVRAADLTRGMYWVTKQDPMVVRSALDVPGSNGSQYVSTLTSVIR